MNVHLTAGIQFSLLGKCEERNKKSAALLGDAKTPMQVWGFAAKHGADPSIYSAYRKRGDSAFVTGEEAEKSKLRLEDAAPVHKAKQQESSKTTKSGNKHGSPVILVEEKSRAVTGLWRRRRRGRGFFGGIAHGIKKVAKAVVKVVKKVVKAVVKVVKAVVNFIGKCHNVFGPKSLLKITGLSMRGSLVEKNVSGVKCVGANGPQTATAEVRKGKTVQCKGSRPFGCVRAGGTLTTAEGKFSAAISAKSGLSRRRKPAAPRRRRI